MSEENVEVVRRMYEAFHAGDAEGSMGHYSADVRVDAKRLPDRASGRGLEALQSIIGGWLGAFEGWSEEIEDIRAVDDRVLVIATQRGRGRESGVEVETRYALVYEVEGGKITSLTLYPDPEEGLAAAQSAG